MDIDISDTAPHQLMSLNKKERLIIICNQDPWQSSKERQYFFPVSQVATSQFTNHHGVDEHLVPIQQRGQFSIFGTQVANPNGGIDQNHV